MPIKTAIERTLASTSSAIILAAHKWFCVKKSSKGGLVLMNSHSVDHQNRPTGDGVARIFCCATAKRVSEILMQSCRVSK